MAETASSSPVTTAEKTAQRAPAPEAVRPFDLLRREVERLFEDFDNGVWRAPFHHSGFEYEPLRRRRLRGGAAPPVDIVEKSDSFDVSAELPGLDEKNFEVTLADGGLTIRGEKPELPGGRQSDYYLHERRFGAFDRCFALPDSVDAEKVTATFKDGVLTVTLPKKPGSQKISKKIEIKPG